MKHSARIVIGSSVAAMVAAGPAFFILLCHCQVVVDAFNAGPSIIPRASYEYQNQQQQDHLRSLLSTPFEDGRHNDFALSRSRTMSSHVSLHMNTGGGREEESSSMFSSPTINIPLVTRNIANQALIGYGIWTGGTGFKVISEQTSLGAVALILGIVGVIPMLVLSRKIETSESPYVSGLNLSTNMAVLRLFGPTPQPILAFVVSLLMAAVTGIVEETLFRGQCLPAFTYSYGNGDILIGVFLSSLLFAVLHTNPLSLFKGGEAFVDNFTLLILQFVNGTIFAVLFILSGNLAVPMITHTLYDLYIFYKTHLVDVAGQMEYAEEESLMPICSSNRIEKKYLKKFGEEWLKEAKESFYLMDTNRDGELSRKELRVALYSYGIKLSLLESEEIKEAADTDGSGSIDFDEYLEFIGPTGSRSKAIRNTLLGPT